MITEASPVTDQRAGGEPELITRARARDPQAWAAVFNEGRDDVFLFLYRRTSGNKQLAEDLTSETFLRALRRIDTFRWTGRHINAWLVTIARNLLADHLKSSLVQRERSTADMLDHDRLEPSTEELVLRSLEAHQATLLLDQAMHELTGHQRACLRLRFWQHLTVAETARVLGIEVGACKTLQSRAVRRLAALLVDAEVPQAAEPVQAVAA